MSDTPDLSSELPDTEYLPPVEPPSAGFIVKLFMVPALIVAAVIVVYLLFGVIASGDVDWRQLVADIRNENPHVRNRGALRLAELLNVEANSPNTENRLSENSEIATALADLYRKLIKKNSAFSDEETREVEFLSHAIGRSDAWDLVQPALLEGLSPEHQAEVRIYSLTAIAMIAGRALEKGRAFDASGVMERIIELSRSNETVFRHHAAFTLGILGGPTSLSRLEEMLQDTDEMARVNAAIGFARQNSLKGLPVLKKVLNDAADHPLPEVARDQTQIERMTMLKNSFRAIESLKSSLSDTDRESILNSLKKITTANIATSLKYQAEQLVLSLKN